MTLHAKKLSLIRWVTDIGESYLIDHLESIKEKGIQDKDPEFILQYLRHIHASEKASELGQVLVHKTLMEEFV